MKNSMITIDGIRFESGIFIAKDLADGIDKYKIIHFKNCIFNDMTIRELHKIIIFDNCVFKNLTMESMINSYVKFNDCNNGEKTTNYDKPGIKFIYCNSIILEINNNNKFNLNLLMCSFKYCGLFECDCDLSVSIDRCSIQSWKNYTNKYIKNLHILHSHGVHNNMQGTHTSIHDSMFSNKHFYTVENSIILDQNKDYSESKTVHISDIINDMNFNESSDYFLAYPDKHDNFVFNIVPLTGSDHLQNLNYSDKLYITGKNKNILISKRDIDFDFERNKNRIIFISHEMIKDLYHII